MTFWISNFSINEIFKAGGPDVHDIDIDKLEKLIIRIAIFSVLYTFPGKYRNNPSQYDPNSKINQPSF